MQVRIGCTGATPWGDFRYFAFYAIYETPSIMFDGVISAIGTAVDPNDQYPWYESELLARAAIPTDVTIDLTAYPVVGTTYRFGTRVCLEPAGTARTVRVYLAQTLNRWPHDDPKDPPYARNTFMQAAPAVDVDLVPGQCELILSELELNADSWAERDNIRIVAWVQEPQVTSPPSDRAEVHQAAEMPWPFVLDCNANGIDDAEDIASGFSLDLNGNGVPDECESIYAGIDLWTTPAGGTSEILMDANDLPPDFFGPGSDPFDGPIVLGGEPLPTEPPGVLGAADTVVRRTQDAVILEVPSQDTVPIEIVALNLVSVQPITVTYEGGQNPEAWDVRVCLSDAPQDPGTMTIQRACLDGGTYDASLPVKPRLVFTRVGDDATRVWDMGLAGVEPLMLNTIGGGWVDEPDPASAVTEVAAGTQVDANCDGVFDPPLPGTSNFVPGIHLFPCDPTVPPGAAEQRMRITYQRAGTMQHGIISAHAPAPDGDVDGIDDVADNCPGDFNPLQEDGDGDTWGDLCDNCPAHYDPYLTDCDSDGMGDICQIEAGLADDCNTNGVPDSCDIADGTSRDQDGGGVPDECEYCPGSANCDIYVNYLDIDFFVAGMNDNVAAWEAMFAPGAPICPFENLDANGDGFVNFRDIDAFVALQNTTCP